MDVDIITGKEVSKGYRVKEDIVIRTIAWVKKKFGLYQGNNLYVSEESLDEYKKRRSKFERYVLFGSVFVFIIFLISVVLPLFSGDFSRVLTNIVAVLGIGFVVAFLVLFSYVPSIEDKITVIKEEKAEKKEEKKVETKPEQGKNEEKEKIKEIKEKRYKYKKKTKKG